MKIEEENGEGKKGYKNGHPPCSSANNIFSAMEKDQFENRTKSRVEGDCLLCEGDEDG